MVQVLPIYIVHGVEKRVLIVFREEEDGINIVVPAQVINVQQGNVICPYQLPMILVPSKEHQTAKEEKILILR
jgi:hypothetical protein